MATVPRGSWSCPVCQKTFSRKFVLDCHYATHTGEKRFECGCCGARFSSSGQRKLHSKKHPGGHVFKCTKCTASFVTTSELREHYIVHPRRRRSASLSSAPIVAKVKVGVEKPRTPYRCKVCKKSFHHKTYVRKHYQRVHQNQCPYECGVCNKKFRWRYPYSVHIVDHPNGLVYKCTKCSMKFKTAGELTVHKKIHRTVKYVCDICDEEFSYSRQILKHSKIHTRERCFRCSACAMCFDAASDLGAHIISHGTATVGRDTAPARYHCDHCSVCFSRPELLKAHVQKHVNPTPYQCEVCGKFFSCKGNLRIHRRIHTGVKPYPCEFCEKRFRESGHLVKHRRIHTGERPYICELCGKSFTDSGKVNRHLKNVHGKKKTQKQLQSGQMDSIVNAAMLPGVPDQPDVPYECGVCYNMFANPVDIVEHMKTHTGDSTPCLFVPHPPITTAVSSGTPPVISDSQILDDDRLVDDLLDQPPLEESNPASTDLPANPIRNILSSIEEAISCPGVDTDDVVRSSGASDIDSNHSSSPVQTSRESRSYAEASTASAASRVASSSRMPSTSSSVRLDTASPAPSIAFISNRDHSGFLHENSSVAVMPTTEFTGQESAFRAEIELLHNAEHQRPSHKKPAGRRNNKSRLPNPFIPPRVKSKAYYDVYNKLDKIPEDQQNDLTCETCHKVFKRQHTLARHKRAYHEVGFECKYCDVKFPHYVTLVRHLVTHPEYDMRCLICNKQFDQFKKLYRHAGYHASQTANPCELCNKTFSQSRSLDEHIQSAHSESQPHQCEHCGKMFKLKANLDSHLLIHTGEKPFGPCEFCGKFFRERGQLKRHLRTHSGERPYKCLYCYKDFVDSSSRNRHCNYVHKDIMDADRNFDSMVVLHNPVAEPCI